MKKLLLLFLLIPSFVFASTQIRPLPYKDALVADAITVSSDGTVDDGALSATVTNLGDTIEGSEITDETITSSDIATSAVTSSEILNGTIVSADIDANAALTDAQVSDSITVGAGGTISNSAIPALAYGSFYSTDNAVATTISTVNVAVKAAGTTTSTNLSQFTMPQNNRLTYTGSNTKKFILHVNGTLESIAGVDKLAVEVFKNGLQLAGLHQHGIVNNSLVTPVSSNGIVVNIATNDYFEIYVKNETDNSNITAQDFDLTIVEIR